MDGAARCDELVLMREGGTVGSAPPERLLREPGSESLEQVFIAADARRGRAMALRRRLLHARRNVAGLRLSDSKRGQSDLG